ncbi:MAG: ABC transporter permease [Bacteroidetes bacterium]|nr:ABC transporter permease [Bacteroidota bacterium]
MLRNFVKVAIRNILRNKVYSFINIAGLAVGMAACILILLWVTDELSFNNFNKNLNRIFLVPQTQHYKTVGDFTVSPTPMPLAETLKEEYPQVEYSTRYEPWLGERVLEHNERRFNEQINFADSSFFNVFSFDFVEGNPNTALTNPNSIVLTEETARKFFGKEDPIGKVLSMDAKVDLKVTGIIKDVPKNSDLQFDGLVPTDVMKDYGFNISEWGGNMIMTYVLLRNPQQAVELSREIRALLKKQYNDPTAGKLFLFPFKDYHLYSFSGKGGRIEDVILFSVVAFFILIIACINFMNLATARSARRATEVGVKKVVGATRFQIAKQFLGESIILTVISLGFALVLVELFLPYFNEIVGKSLQLGQMNLTSVLSILAVTVVSGILAGVYPSIFLSSFKPASILKKTMPDISSRFSVRSILVVLQFVISIALIICTSIVYFQLKYINNKDLGLNPRNVVYFRLSPTLANGTDRLKNELKANPNILSVTSVSNLPIEIYMNGGEWSWEGKPANENPLVSFTGVGYDYLKTFDMTLKAGRFFSREHPADDSASAVINESFAKLIGSKFHLGMRLSSGGYPLTAIGVVNDFNFSSLRNKIGPLAIFYNRPQPQYLSAQYICAKVNNNDLTATLGFIQKTCKSIDPNFVFNYHFLDKTFEKMYTSEEGLGRIFGSFAVIAIIIACLGLFGLSSFAAEVKTKEIGIRKVLGASVPEIIYLLSKEFVSWVLIANLIAWPVAYYFMNKWLQDFAYRTSINLWVFILAGGLALLIALFTTSFQAIKAATANPVEALRYE